jgi:DNA-binding transcriptional MerR regulator
VSTELDISAATLRRWSDEFNEFLTEEAGSGNQRRYQDSDIATLSAIRDLMNEGLTSAQIRYQLSQRENVTPVEPDSILYQTEAEDDLPPPLTLDDRVEENSRHSGAAIIASNGAEAAVEFLNNTLATLSDSQKSILNSQAANRELLGVLLQDNFNLKDENNRLRDRILEVEREVAQNRQEDEWRREALRQELDAKITAATQLATQAITTASSIEIPEIKAVPNKSGCLGMLFGGGGTQFVTVPRKARPAPSGPAPVAPPPQPVTPPGGSHPKPMFPPE